MPLSLPPADERTFASLVAEARSRIPRLSPGWTDHNAHDPGITLIELFAQLTELDLYRLGRVTAAERRAFLRWFGLESSGPSVAETVVALQLPRGHGAAAPMPLVSDREITSAAAELVFSTTTPVTVQPGGFAGMFVGERQIFASDPAVAAAVLAAPVAVLGSLGHDPLVVALDHPALGELCFYLWTGAPDHDADVRRRLQAEAADVARDRATYVRRSRGSKSAPLETGEVARDWSPRSAPRPLSRLDDWTRHHEVDVAWEAYTETGWTAVAQIDDQTRALTLSGFVRLRVEAGLAAGAVAAAPEAYAVRVRLVRGRYEVPPVLQGVLLNAVVARHQSRPFKVRLGESNGRAGQSLRLPRSSEVPEQGAPLVFDRTEVTITPRAGAPAKWAVAVDWDRAGADSPHVVLDADAAELNFGNGLGGRVPPAGAGIDLLSRVGGGPAGNVSAHSLKRLPIDAATADLSVVQPFTARGGGPASSIAELQVRALADLARPTRAATLADFERLALETPGLPSGRAHAIADHHPDFPGLPAPGCVTVVVVPRGTGAGPEPTSGFLNAVRRYLGRRRPVATEVHVIAPTYTKLSVRARLHLSAYADAPVVSAEASARLNAFFHPLTGGPDAGGWPVGRDVYRSEVLALLQGVTGVHHVDELSLLVGPEREPRCHNVSVCATDLVAANSHDLTVASARIR